MKRPNRSFYVTLILIAVAITYLIYSQNLLVREGILLNAKTLDWVSSAKVTNNLKYEFYYKGERKVGYNTYNKFQGNSDFIGKSFPVMYTPKWGGHYQILVVPSDFKEFNLPFPDSLKWVLRYLDK